MKTHTKLLDPRKAPFCDACYCENRAVVDLGKHIRLVGNSSSVRYACNKHSNNAGNKLQELDRDELRTIGDAIALSECDDPWDDGY